MCCKKSLWREDISEIYAHIRNKYLHKIEKFSIFAVANTKN